MAKLTTRELVEAREARNLEDWVIHSWTTRREYMTEWQNRLAKLDAFIAGDWAVEFPDGRVVRDKPKTENRIASKIEDFGGLAGAILPTIRVEALNERDKTGSELRERIIQYYWQLSDMKLIIPRLFMDMIGTGLAAMLVWPDFSKQVGDRFPLMRRIDPRFVLPPLDYVIEGTLEPHDVITNRMVKIRNLANDYPDKAAQLQQAAQKIAASVNRGKKPGQHMAIDTSQVLVIEYWGRDAIMRIALIDGYPETVVTLENQYNATDCCPVVLGVRPTSDGRIRGKVEHMMPALAAENRMLTYVLDYADQAIYAPIKKRGTVVNAEDFGPNAIIDLGPDGDIDRVPPAAIRPEVFKVIQDLERHSRRAGNFPEARAGDVSQSIGSAAFVDSLMGGLTTEVQTLQSVMEVALRKANEIAQMQDKTFCDAPNKVIYGLARGGSFREKYTPSIDLKDVSNFVSYGAGQGLDKYNAEVRISQRQRMGYVSERWVRENLDGVENVSAEEERIIEEQMLKSMLAGMFAQAQQAGNIQPLAEFYAILKKEKNPLMALERVAATSVPLNQPPGPAPTAPGANPAGEALALQKGGIPGQAAGLPAPPGQTPPLTQIFESV